MVASTVEKHARNTQRTGGFGRVNRSAGSQRACSSQGRQKAPAERGGDRTPSSRGEGAWVGRRTEVCKHVARTFAALALRMMSDDPESMNIMGAKRRPPRGEGIERPHREGRGHGLGDATEVCKHAARTSRVRTQRGQGRRTCWLVVVPAMARRDINGYGRVESHGREGC